MLMINRGLTRFRFCQRCWGLLAIEQQKRSLDGHQQNAVFSAELISLSLGGRGHLIASGASEAIEHHHACSDVLLVLR
jgi:hypothetical protein